MSRRRRQGERVNVLDQPVNDLQAVTDEIYRTPNNPDLDTGRVVAEPISTLLILPDPRQPRRAIPSAVRHYWMHPHMPSRNPGEPQISNAMFTDWMVRAYCETCGIPFNLEQKRQLSDADGPSAVVTELYRLIITGGDVQRPEKPGPLESALLKIVDLAATIHRDGLAHPIRVFKDADGYGILIGERRYLAYRLLEYFEHGGYDKIPAIIGEYNVFQQAAENNVRDDLNAIGKARQFAILLMALLEQETPPPTPPHPTGTLRSSDREGRFQPMAAFEREQDFYAQVADAEQFRIPYGKSGDLLNAMGVKDRASLSEYRTLLSLPNAAWVQSDDESWGINELVQIVRSSNNSEPESEPDKPAADNPYIPNEPSNPPAPPTDSRAGHKESPATDSVSRPKGRWPGVGDKVVLIRNGELGEVKRILAATSQVEVIFERRHSLCYIAELRQPTEAELNPQPVQGINNPDPVDWVGKRIRSGQSGIEGVVYAISENGLLNARTDDGVGFTLSLADAVQIWTEEIDGEQIEYTTTEIHPEGPKKGQFARAFSFPIIWEEIRDGGRTRVIDRYGQYVGHWTPSAKDKDESLEIFDWLIMLGNALFASEHLQRTHRIFDYLEGSALDDYLPGDAMDDVDEVLEALLEAKRIIQQDMDRVE